MKRTSDSGAGSRFLLGSLLLSLAVLLLALNARWLFAQGYARYASEHLQNGAPDDHGLVAARWAVELTPYAVRNRVIYAEALTRGGRHADAQDVLRLAVAYGGRDPSAWQAYVRYKLSLNQVDEQLVQAMSRVYQLAPNRWDLHLENARLGLKYWAWGGEEHHRIWASSVRFVLDIDSREFLRYVLQVRQEKLFCDSFVKPGEPLSGWCRRARHVREACSAASPRQGYRPWCRHFVGEPLR